MTANTPFGMVDMPREDSGFLADGSDEENLIIPGLYTFSNGAGGGDVGPLPQQTAITVPASQFTWTNRDAITALSRNQDQAIAWTGGDDAREVVVILGYSARVDEGVMSAFACAQRPSAGGFTLPAWMLSTLPASSPWDPETGEDPPSGLIVGRMSRLDQNRFAASGLDAGLVFYLLVDYRIVPVQ